MIARIVIATSFFLLAGWFVVNPFESTPPVVPTVPVGRAAISTDPPRVRMRGTPTARIAGLDMKCSDCHKIFESAPRTPDELRQHEHLVHDHGMNDRCFNCHSKENRNLLVLHDGSEVPFEDVVPLCAKCHGTVYRDWERGSHGRTHGSWDPASGELWRLVCTDCHDPHAPAFDPIRPLPGPNTFRLGERKVDAGGHGAQGPLERLLGHAPAHEASEVHE